MELVRTIVVFLGLDSVKWRVVDPRTLKWKLKVVSSIHERLKYLLEKPAELSAEAEDTHLPDVCAWYPGMLQRYADQAPQPKPESVSKASYLRSSTPLPEPLPIPQATKASPAHVTMISEKSKVIKKASGEVYFAKLYKKHLLIFDEIRKLREAIKTADAEKAAANERLEKLLSSNAVLQDAESACEES